MGSEMARILMEQIHDGKKGKTERIRAAAEKAMDTIERKELEELYKAAGIEDKSGAVETALKMVLSEELAERIQKGKKIAKTNDMSFGSAAIFMAEEA